ncbi:MAG: Response regulator rcp1 [Phycisphaerae bacterium]|nr:Response regulator rcp1 [Phycisphaerae bacterium]
MMTLVPNITPDQKTHQSNAPLKILLVEDDYAHAKLIQKIIREIERPISVLHIYDGEKAVDFLLHWPRHHDPSRVLIPDLVFLDLKMPKLNGFEFLKQIRDNPFLQEMKIIVVTTSNSISEISLAYESGANGYITKAGDYQEFKQNLISAIDFATNR